MKVMIIDDEPIHVRGFIKYINWSKLGFEKVIGTYKVKEALHILSEEAFDLVVTDINMPEINGLDLIRRIHLLGKRPDIMIVSGYNEFTYAQEAIRLGVFAYLLKPVKPEEMEENLLMLAEKNRWKQFDEDNKVECDILSRIRADEIWSEDKGSEKSKSQYTKCENKCIHPSIQKILIFVGKNYGKDLTVQEIAEQFQLNESYLSALFKKEVGITLSHYMQRYRIYRAMELLKNSDLRINEIAYRVGYQNPCYFTEQFKKIFDVTPSEIRKNHMRM